MDAGPVKAAVVVAEVDVTAAGDVAAAEAVGCDDICASAQIAPPTASKSREP